ncbi:hypothetical protein BKA83DRAFT_4210222 [Pisolithus microcarpus]|nr:hypothetical protein BKA83DRAFT_4210222 [Pisolithus microcarpus]
MLTVHLSLTPGESRTYTTYSFPMLPANLLLKFPYELVVGTCHASASAMQSSSSLGPTGANSVSRIMKVLIHVYNHVVMNVTPRSYDLLWPVTRQHTTAEFAPKVSNKGSVPPPSSCMHARVLLIYEKNSLRTVPTRDPDTWFYC